MSRFVYFDTDALRNIASALREASQAVDLRGHLAHSQITLLELISQIASKASGKVFEQIRALPHFTNRKTALLPRPDDFLAGVISGSPLSVDHQNVKTRELEINACLAASSVSEIRDPAGRLKGELDKHKTEMANMLVSIVDQYRQERNKFDDLWTDGLLKRTGLPSNICSRQSIISKLSALYEFDKHGFEAALSDVNYPATKYSNDNLDREQLIYLADQSLHFVTCDKQYSKKTVASSHSERIHTVKPEELNSPENGEKLLRHIVG